MRITSDLRSRLRAALEEDVRKGDVTSEATIPERARGRAVMRAKQAGVISGLTVGRAVFRLADSRLRVEIPVFDGDRVEPGETVMAIAGPLRAILLSERVALNFIQRMSGIATLTARYVEAVAGTRAEIYDTRKTTPLWRGLDRFAVHCGGGRNHRYCLDDMILIKDNHVDVTGSVGAAVERARAWRRANPRRRPRVKIMAETRNLAETREALQAGADLIMLDNMSSRQIRRAVEIVAGRVPLEVSGGVTLSRARAVARLGVDRISIGALTHSAPSLDVSLSYEE